MFNRAMLTSILEVKDLAPPAVQKLRVAYRVAPMYVCRREKGKACFFFQVAGESGLIILPYPKWFKRHTYRPLSEISKTGKPTLHPVKGFKDYARSCILKMVSDLLIKKNYSTFELYTQDA